jgi:thiamine pyrophosphate-dependent acetolactate synthase large subunit-like protein
MAERVADVCGSMLAGAGVKRCNGIVGDALNPVIDGLRRDGQVEFIHVRNEQAGAFAAVAEACLTNSPVAVCGTAGPGLMHLLNGLVDAQREGAPVIAIAGDVFGSDKGSEGDLGRDDDGALAGQRHVFGRVDLGARHQDEQPLAPERHLRVVSHGDSRAGE